MTKHTITRDGQPPITFSGEKLAEADNKTQNSTRWTVVAIWETKGKRIVASLKRVTKWQGESDRTSASSFDDLGEVIEWLKNDEDVLGSVSQQAIEQVVEARPELARFWAEEVE